MARLGQLMPGLKGWLLDKALENKMRTMFPNLEPSWRLLPAPPDANANAVFSDALVDRLSSGKIRSVSGIRYCDKTMVVTELDGSLEVDVIILCTGYQFDYGILS